MTKDEILKKLAKFKEEHSSTFGIEEIGLFGSYAKGLNTQESDIDIFIKTKSPNPFIILEIKESLEGILKSKIDIVRLRKAMNPFLKSSIERDGIYA